MALDEQDHQRVGSVLLRWDGEEPPADDEILVDLSASPGRVRQWESGGALLGVQALHPLGDVAPSERRSWKLLAYGPGAGLAALTARALGLQTVHVLVGDEEERALADFSASATVHVHRRWEDLPRNLVVHRALLGCAGTPPDLEVCQALARRLRQEGQLVLFGLPAAQLETWVGRLGDRSLSLRGVGRRDGLAYLSGTPNDLRRFLK